MSKHDEIQQGPPDYLSPPLSQSQLLGRQDALRATHTEALQSVESMVREQQEVSTHLNDGIAQMKRRSADMDALEVTQSPGLLARITRLISRRDDVLARRSISDALVQTHERSVIDLRRASEVADNLQRTAAELHSEVEELTAEQSQARQNLRLAIDDGLVHALAKVIDRTGELVDQLVQRIVDDVVSGVGHDGTLPSCWGVPSRS